MASKRHRRRAARETRSPRRSWTLRVCPGCVAVNAGAGRMRSAYVFLGRPDKRLCSVCAPVVQLGGRPGVAISWPWIERPTEAQVAAQLEEARRFLYRLA